MASETNPMKVDCTQLRYLLDKAEFARTLELIQICNIESFRNTILFWVFDAFKQYTNKHSQTESNISASICDEEIKITKNTLMKLVRHLLKLELDVNVIQEHKSVLLAAVETSDVDIVLLLLQHGSDPNLVVGEEEIGPLGLAVSLGYYDIAKNLIQNGADVNKACYLGLTPLQLSVNTARSIDISKLLIQTGASIHSVLDFLPESLSSAILIETLQSKKDYFASILLDHGEVINTFPDFEVYQTYSPLIRAVLGRNVYLTTVLLEMGEDVNQTFGEGLDTPLHIAVKSDNIDMIKVLIKYGADLDRLNGRGHSPLGCALQPDKTEEISRILLDSGCSRTKTSLIALFQRDFTPLHIAAYRGIFGIVKFLLEEETVFHSSCNTECSKSENAEKDLLEDINLSLDTVFLNDDKIANQKALIKEYTNIKASDGSTPLYMAVLGGNLEIARYLLKLGGEPDVVCCHGNLVHAAVLSSSSVEMLEFALSFGCDVNLYSEYANTPLLLAARASDVKILTKLVEEGASLNIKDRFGETALSASVYFGCEENAKVLIAHGADPDIADCRGTTAVYWSIFNGREKLLKLLIEAGAHLTRKQFSSYPRNLTVMRKEDLISWVENEISQPQSLQQSCRVVIRRHIRSICAGLSIIENIMLLPLPLKLRNYLCLRSV